MLDLGYEDSLIFRDYDYASAVIGVDHTGRVIYDFDKMVEWLMEKEGWTEEECIEWIEYNTLRAIPYYSEGLPPIVMYNYTEVFKEYEENT